MEEKLETKAEKKKTVTLEEKLQVLSLEDYVAKFSERYKNEDYFKSLVHRYLSLSRIDKLKLSIGRKLSRSWYEKRTSKLVENYAVKVREDSLKLAELRKNLAELNKQEEKLRETETEAKKAEQQYTETEKQLIETKQKAEAELNKAKNEKDNIFINAEEVARKKLEQFQNAPEATEIAKEQFKEYVTRSELLRKGDDGNIVFNEENLISRLEDLLLEEVVKEIENEDGRGSFIARVRETYEGLIDYWSEIEDISEVHNMDIIQSLIYSRTKGYRIPTYPYFITGKSEETEKKVFTSLDTAIAIDTSGSMEGQKYQAAKKTALATNALMKRKLNKDNKTFLAEFNSSLTEITASDLIKKEEARGGSTRTDYALKWIIDTLKDRGPSVAYLITDGYPEPESAIEESIRIAKEFQYHPNILLRIFLIEGNDRSKNIIRKIGRTAGNGTKVSPVDSYKLAQGIIKDISQSIGNMYDISKF